MSEHSSGFYGRLAAAVIDHPWRTIFGVILVSALSVFLLVRIRMDPDLVDLLPQDDPTTQAIQALNKEDGAVNLTTIAIKGEDPAVVDAFMLDMQKRLDAMPEVDFTLYKLDPDTAWHLGLLSMPSEDLGKLRDRLRGALALGPAIQNPFIAAQWLDLSSLTDRLKVKSSEGPLATPDGVSRILIRPKRPATDMAFSTPFMAKIDAMLADMKPDSLGLKVAWIGGAYRHNVEDLQGINDDLQQTNTASLVLVLVLIIAAYRNLRSVLLIFAPILLGNLWALGFAGIAVGTLTNFTAFFSAILVGLGIEFSVHLYSRYREEREHIGDTREAIIHTWNIVGPPSLTSALASAGGFLALWAARFQGFQQLGTLLAGGNLLCLFAVLITLPILIYWLERKQVVVPKPAHTTARHRRHRTPSTYRLAPLGLSLLTLVTIASAFMLPRIPFQFDVSELRRPGMGYSELDPEERKLAEDSFAPVVVTYPDDASLVKDFTRLNDLIAKGHLPEVSRALSIHSVLPVDMDARVAVLQELAAMASNPNVKYLPAVVQENLAHIAKDGATALTRDELPKSLRTLLGAAGDNHWMMLFPAGNMWDLRETAKLYDALHKAVPDRPLAGQYLALAVLYRLVGGDAPRVAGVALLIVFVLTALDLRNLKWGIGAIATLIAGLCWSGAGMALFQVKLSMVNFVGIPILIGIAVDAIIHLLHRLSEEGPGRIRRALVTTGWAVALGALTNAGSFASLVFASTEGVRSLGFLVVIGLTMVTLAAFILVPLGWMTAWKITGKMPRDLGGDHGVHEEE